jgi:hypothetical protein
MMINWELKHRIVEGFGRQADFALKIGRTQSAVSEVIHGRRQLSLAEQKRWAKELFCKPERLFPIKWQAHKVTD